MDASFVSDSTSLDIIFQRKTAQMHVAMPAKIISFNAASQTVSVQPSNRMKVTLEDVVKFVDLPQLHDIPVILPFSQTAGFCLTLPIQAGDTCLLIIPDRSMESFLTGDGSPSTPYVGGNLQTSNVRAHNLADAIAIPGLSTSSKALPEYSTSAVELRDKERKSFISLGPDGIEINDGKGFVMKIADGGCTVTASGSVTTSANGNITMTTPAAMELQSQNVNLTDSGNEFGTGIKLRSGTVTDGEGVVLGSHVHTGVQTGSGNTGQPNK